MLQAYRIETYISIDGKKQYMPFATKIILAEDLEFKVIHKTYTFQELVDSNAAGVDFILIGKLWPFDKPYVKVQYSWSCEVKYVEFDTLTVEKHYEPYNITMNELFDEFPAEQCIQYLKERGMTACPILK